MNTQPTELEIEFCMTNLLPELQTMVDNHYTTFMRPTQMVIGKTFLSSGKPPLLVIDKGRVYWKLVLENQNDHGGAGIGYSRTVYGFVRRKDGAIFKAATYRRPQTETKTAIRGYITDESPMEYFTPHGVIYAQQ